MQEKKTAVIEESVVAGLQARMRGELIQPGDESYDEARKIWNGMIDKKPALIARCASVADVVASVNFARENGILLAVRGGGHNVAGTAIADGGLVVDLSPMKGVRVDAERHTVRAEGGVTIGNLREDADVRSRHPDGRGLGDRIAGLTLGGARCLAPQYGLSSETTSSPWHRHTEGAVSYASRRPRTRYLSWESGAEGVTWGVSPRSSTGSTPSVPVMLCFSLLYPETGRGGAAVREEYVTQAPDESSPGVLVRVPHEALFPERGTVSLRGDTSHVLGQCRGGASRYSSL